jgi:pilus assembly protein Flp/PilA
MLRHRVTINKPLKCMRADKGGVVSFEYVAVAACIVATVTAVFTATGSNSISDALTSMMATITAAIK